MEVSNFLLFLLIFSTKPTDTTNGVLQPSLPLFSWIDELKMQVAFPDGSQDTIVLWPAENIADMKITCLYEGTMEGEPSADLVVSGCKDDNLVSITIHSDRLVSRTMFDLSGNVTEEIHNRYANAKQILGEVLEDEVISSRVKRNVFEDYVVNQDYDEVESDGNVDPPPRLSLDIKLGFEESLKKHLGGEDNAREYVMKVFTHGRSYMKHASLGTSVRLNLVEPPIFIPNKTWKANRDSLADAKTVKANENIPHIFFCFDGDNDEYMGVSSIRKACDPADGVVIIKYRKDVPLAANTFNHENGHIMGLQHDKEEDGKSGYDSQDDGCHGHGFMSEVSPSVRPEQWTRCNKRRFKLWYNHRGKDCLKEDGIPDTFMSCPFSWTADIKPCLCKVDPQYNIHLFCPAMTEELMSEIVSNFQCSKQKIYRMEINMNGQELSNCNFGLDNLGRLEMQYFHIFNVSEVAVDFEANAFQGSANALMEINIQRLPGLENAGRTLKTESISNLASLENINLGEDFEILESKSLSGLPSVTTLTLKGVKTIESNAIYDMANLKRVILTKNGLTELRSNIFDKVPKLSIVDLSNNLITSLPSNSFNNLPSLTKVYLNNNKIAAIDNNAMKTLPQLIYLDISQNQIKYIGNALENIKNRDLVIDFSNNKIEHLNELSYKSFVENIVNQGGRGFLEVGHLNLQCGCDIKWLISQPGNAGISKFHNAQCQDGHKLEEVDVQMVQRLCSGENCGGMYVGAGRLYFQKEETKLKQGSRLATLPRIRKEYLVSVDFMVNTFVDRLQSIFHFTVVDKNTGSHGGRIPTLWINRRTFLVGASIGGTNKEFTVDSTIPTNKWINIKISQKLVNGGYMFAVLVDGQQKHSEVNNNPQEFTNVIVYAPNPGWHATLKGSIRNFYIRQ